MNVHKEHFGSTSDGKGVDRIIIENGNGIRIAVLSYGGILQSVRIPELGAGTTPSREIVLGFDSLEEYLAGHPFFGATVGRVANRIAGGTFTLDGRTYSLYTGDSPNSLHGGKEGFDKKLWQAETFADGERAGVQLHRISPDGEENYPGNLDVTVTMSLNEANELAFDYRATTDKTTPVNLTNHSYWNLSGAGTIRDHRLALYADYYLPVDDTAIPTGERRAVDGTPFDFRESKPIGRDIEETPEHGYDHCYVLREYAGREKAHASFEELTPVAQVTDPSGSVTMEVATTKPGVQFYSANKVAGLPNRQGQTLDRHAALCLETQHFPNAVNEPSFPSPFLEPDQVYEHRTVHRFRFS
jgi:aldose 1-epimerase